MNPFRHWQYRFVHHIHIVHSIEGNRTIWSTEHFIKLKTRNPDIIISLSECWPSHQTIYTMRIVCNKWLQYAFGWLNPFWLLCSSHWINGERKKTTVFISMTLAWKSINFRNCKNVNWTAFLWMLLLKGIKYEL